MSPDPLILVDTLNLAWRSHFAFPTLSCDGLPTGLFYGFLKGILSLRIISKRMVFCWDHGVPGDPPEPYWRKTIFPAYKENRKPAGDPELQQVQKQLPLLANLASWLGYPSMGVPGWEADDCIGVLAHLADCPVLIYSTDEDLYQLLTPDNRVQVIAPTGKQSRARFRYVNAQMVEHEYGFGVDRWIDYLAMGGDTADHYTAKGMGPQTAAKLVMAGADPNQSFSDQWPAVQETFSRWEPSWPQVQVAAQLATICTTIDRPIRIPDGPEWAEPDGRKDGEKRFVGFCADYGMLEFLGNKRKFFQ